MEYGKKLAGVVGEEHEVLDNITERIRLLEAFLKADAVDTATSVTTLRNVVSGLLEEIGDTIESRMETLNQIRLETIDKLYEQGVPIRDIMLM